MDDEDDPRAGGVGTGGERTKKAASELKISRLSSRCRSARNSARSRACPGVVRNSRRMMCSRVARWPWRSMRKISRPAKASMGRSAAGGAGRSKTAATR